MPAFVRMTEPSTPTQRKLVDLGAQRFPDGDWDDLARRLDGDAAKAPHQVALPVTEEPRQDAASPSSQPSDGGTLAAPLVAQAPASEQAPLAGTIYSAVLPIVLSHLAEPRDAESLAAALDVQKAQLQRWLAMAVEQGTVEKLRKSGHVTSPRASPGSRSTPMQRRSDGSHAKAWSDSRRS